MKYFWNLNFYENIINMKKKLVILKEKLVKNEHLIEKIFKIILKKGQTKILT